MKEGRIAAVLAVNRTETGFFRDTVARLMVVQYLGSKYCRVGSLMGILESIHSHFKGKLGMRICETVIAGEGNELLLFLLQSMYNIQLENFCLQATQWHF